MRLRIIYTLMITLFIATTGFADEATRAQFNGDWTGSISPSNGGSFEVRMVISDSVVTQYFKDDSGWSQVSPDKSIISFDRNNFVFVWLNSGGAWSETQIFSLSFISSGKLDLVWSRHVNNVRSRAANESWNLSGIGSLVASNSASLDGSSSSNSSLISNGGFENGFTGYKAETYGGALSARFTVDSKVSRSGNASLHITNDDPAAPQVYRGFIQTINGLKAGSTYEVSFWVKANFANSKSSLDVLMDGAIGQPWTQRIYSDSGSYQWRQYKGRITLKDLNSMTLRINTEDRCEVWLDDIEIHEVR